MGILPFSVTTLSSCASDTLTVGDVTIEFPGSIAYACDHLGGEWNIIVSDWNAESTFNLTANMPGKHRHPDFGPNGEVYFSSEGVVDEGVVERSINVIHDIRDPEGSLEKKVVALSSGSTYDGVKNPMVTPDGTRLIYVREKYECPEESGIYTINLPDGEPYPSAVGVLFSILEITFIPGTNEVLMAHSDSEVSSLKVVNIVTGAIDDYIFDASSHGVSFNETYFISIAATRDRKIYGVANRPGGTFTHLWSWDYDNPTSVSRLAGSTQTPAGVHKAWWTDLRYLENLDGEEDYMLMMFYRNMFYDIHRSLGYSKVVDIGTITGWEPKFMKSIVSTSQGDNREIAWTPYSIDEL